VYLLAIVMGVFVAIAAALVCFKSNTPAHSITSRRNL